MLMQLQTSLKHCSVVLLLSTTPTPLLKSFQSVSILLCSLKSVGVEFSRLLWLSHFPFYDSLTP